MRDGVCKEDAMEYLNLERRTIIPAKQCCLFTSTQNTSTKENETLLAVGTAYVQGEDVAARGRILLFSVVKNPENSQILWTGTELTGVAFSDAPPLYVVSLNIVKNFILLGDIHKSIYFLSWKEQGAQLSLLAKVFASLDCFSTEFLIDGSTLSLVVSDEQKNVQVWALSHVAFMDVV
ncbi:hypothetical protein NC651_027777 [Populus alba x Populus x berolinensis]|nr:hypothetical protein NC651_027777 [Populus alba x Populus x berolinensis]